MLKPFPHPGQQADSSNRPARVGCDLSFVLLCEAASSANIEWVAEYFSPALERGLNCELIVVHRGTDLRLDLLTKITKRLGIATQSLQPPAGCPNALAYAIGLRQARGEVIAVLPTYRQCDPRGVAAMLDTVQAGTDYVASVRTQRVDGYWSRIRSRCFNKLVRILSGVPLHDVSSQLRMMRRAVIETVPLYGDIETYLPVFAARQGFRTAEVDVRHLAEQPAHGRLRQWVRRACDLLTMYFLIRFTQKPFRFFGGIGTCLLMAGVLVNSVLAAQRLFGQQALANRPLLVLGSLCLVLGVQLFSLGLIGELIIFVTAGGLRDYEIDRIVGTSPREDVSPSRPTTD